VVRANKRFAGLFGFGAVLIAGVVSPSFAADELNCDGIDEAADSSSFKVARVRAGSARVNFVNGPRSFSGTPAENDKRKSCPSVSAVCRDKSYVVPGNFVLTREDARGFVCATYVSPRGNATSGWLPTSSLEPLAPPSEPKLADWTGAWKRTEADISIKAKDGKLSAEGSATWGGSDPYRVKNGGVHDGGFDGVAVPRGNVLAIGEGYDGVESPKETPKYDCHVRLRLYGRYLVVEDNKSCGGANVSFTGVYSR
jgi:hypothetical protein